MIICAVFILLITLLLRQFYFCLLPMCWVLHRLPVSQFYTLYFSVFWLWRHPSLNVYIDNSVHGHWWKRDRSWMLKNLYWNFSEHEISEDLAEDHKTCETGVKSGRILYWKQKVGQSAPVFHRHYLPQFWRYIVQCSLPFALW